MLAQLAGLGLTIGGTLFGMNKASSAAKDAERAALLAAATRAAGFREATGLQVQGINDAIGERRSGLDTTLGFLSPFAESGRASTNLLSDALGANGPDAQARYFDAFQTDPGYRATLKAGTDAIEQSRVGGGLLRSGSTLRALQEYGGRLMGSMFSDRLNRLAGLGSAGQGAASAMAGFNNSGSSSIAEYLRSIGEARASGALGAADSTAGGIIGGSNARQRGTQNELAMLGFGMGQAKAPLNDLFGSFGKLIPGMA